MTHTKNKTKVIFWGTPELCIPYLESLTTATNIVAVVTAPDRKIGRKQILTPSPVKIWAKKNNITVFQPEKIDNTFIKDISTHNADVSIVVAFGRILPQEIIDLPKHGTLNIHYSLLPRWRGASPVEAAILAGDKETGVSIQKMVHRLDAGDIIASEFIELYGNEFAYELKDILTGKGVKLLLENLFEYINGNISLQAQDENLVTKCNTIKKSEGEITRNEDSIVLWRKYRAYFGWPGIFFFDKNKKRIKITEAQY